MSKNDLAKEINSKLKSDSIINNTKVAAEINRKSGIGSRDTLISLCNENASLIGLETFSNNKESNKNGND